MAAREVLTVGHSIHPLERFVELLQGAAVEQVADVRAFPFSRRNPHFNRDPLAQSLEQEGIGYVHLPELGGRRSPVQGSPNRGWEVEAFVGYADHLASPEFDAGLERLEAVAGARRTAAMCAEADWRRCHRRLLSDALTARGWRVLHLGPDGATTEHVLTPFAVVEGDSITYPPVQASLL